MAAMQRRKAALIIGLCGALLTGCTPVDGATGPSPSSSSAPTVAPSAPSPSAVAEEPSSRPTNGYTEPAIGSPPPLEQLLLTPDGFTAYPLGTRFPTASPGTDPIVYDPTRCQDAVAEGARESPAEWGTAYRTWYEEQGNGSWQEPFGINVDADGRLTEIETNWFAGAQIATDRGITLGSPEAQVQAAYPNAEVAELDGQARVYVVRGTRGSLHISVVQDGIHAGPVVGVMLVFDDPQREATTLWATDGTYALRCVYA